MQFIRLPAVIEKIAASRSFLYQEIAAGRFPKPVKIGRRAVAWPVAAVEAWQAERASEA